ANPNYDITVVAGKLTITPTATTGKVLVGNQTKVYDGDAGTDPTTFDITLPKGMTAPKDAWAAADFDTSKINSQNVGDYEVTLSHAGLAKLQAANPNTTIDAKSVTAGKFTITKAPITITGPTVTKVYDGKPYSDQTKLVATITGKPKAGVDLTTPQLGDISKDVDVGDYAIAVTIDADANSNYDITTKAGQLTITPSTTTDKVVVNGDTKVYDGDASTDPTTFKVTLPKGITAPKDGWKAADFDAKITSQNVGDYEVTLSKVGLAKLQATNKNTTIDAKSVTPGKFTITPAKVTVTGPTVTKVYDGQPYSDKTKLVATVTDKPKLGADVVSQLGDISQDVNVGSYDIPVTADAKANPNYEVTVVAGKLTITPTTTTDKVVVDGGTKVYDGDASTDPTTFKVELPKDIVAPTAGWTKDDFDTSGLNSQNVGSYDVTLSKAGLAKLQAANANTTIDTNNVTAGKFTITPAPIIITGPNVTKAYDGDPYTGPVNIDVKGQPANGDKVKYTVGDLSKDTAIGTYPITIMAAASDNPNY
ncbi:MBG domain-containing protein, partial [Lentilactobacillus kisonensis]